MTTFPGYDLCEQLYQGTRTVVYRGTRLADNRSVIIKFLQNEYPTFAELVQFRNQYTIAKNLNLPGIVQPLALETYGNGYGLVMSDEGYIALREWQQGAFSIADVLEIGLQLADTLHGLYQNRAIHKDIKPANILIDPKTRDIKLIDFSIASLLPKETQEIQNPNVLEGTLAYISPEQTGRMNRGIDYRTDFYSLGVTLYELLTGELPFQSDDPMELVHGHIAKSPTFPQTPHPIPHTLLEIVLKLMAKNAEDRYQSALGLKYDLEKCLGQWKDTGKIQPFELGERDICDRFIIPEKLYGREKEVETLLAAFDRVASPSENREVGRKTEMMLVAGNSGIGKTAVINEVHKPIVRQRSYFIKGKFDQFNRNIPFSAFVQAFRSLIGHLLSESEAQLASWKDKILNTLGENVRVITDVIPELERIVGWQPPVTELSGSAAQNRFNLVFSKFIQVFTRPERPLVIFLDDLQWADSASLQLLSLLMGEAKTSELLVLGAYRNGEVSPAHPFILELEKISKNNGIITTLTLESLSQDGLNELISETLSCSRELATPLTELVYQKTKGNPFFSIQFIKALYEGGWIYFNSEFGYWQCDMVSVRQLSLTEDVVEFIALQLQKLSPETQEILKLAACVGNRFDLSTLAIVSEQSEMEIALAVWPALQEGLILPTGEVYKFYQPGEENEILSNFEDRCASYKFLHDRVQQAAYSLISDRQKKETHLKIGRQFLENLSEADREHHLFTIVNHLNWGCDLILDPVERECIARLNLKASRKAKASVAYETSRGYCYAGQKFLNRESWKKNYSLWFNLTLETIESEYFTHNLKVAQKLSQEILNNSIELLDRIKVYELQILFKINENQMNEAIELALEVLSLLGLYLPSQPDKIKENIRSLRQEIALPTAKIANLATLSVVKEEEKLAAIRILTNASSAAYIANPTIYPAIVLQTVRHCIKYGNSPLAASAYSWYGALLCGVFNEIEAGYEFGKLSLKILDKFNIKTLTAKVSNMFNVFVRPWKEHLELAVTALPEAIQVGLENGDLEYAFYAMVQSCNYLFYSGCSLDKVEGEQKRYLPQIIQAKYQFHEGFLRINQQVVHNLLGKTSEPQFLQGSVLDGKTSLSQWLDDNIVFLVFCFYEAQTRLAYLFDDNIQALDAGEQGDRYRQAALGTLYVSEHTFYYSLALLAQNALTPSQWERVAIHQNQLQNWATHAPTNFQHKYDLVVAEKHRVLGEKMKAMEMYDRAIAGAKENGYTQEEALANELAAKFYLHWGKEKIARTYMLEAYYSYARWGAKAKIECLARQYPDLLASILQQHPSPLNSHTTHTISTQGTSTLDLTSAIKASQAISGEIELDALLSTLMRVVLENAGADKGALILNHSGFWEIAVECQKHSCSISTVTLDEARTLPTTIVNTVARTQKILLLNDVSQDSTFAGDRYFIDSQPKSLLCAPIIKQGQLVGILYLENHLTSGAFTTQRMEVLNLLTTQAAISLENAHLYNTLEHKVEQRTTELSQALENLKATQKKLVESEKMAALGTLVAGIAHEINTPIGISITAASTLADETQTFIDRVNQGQLKRSVLNHYLETAWESSDLILGNLQRAGKLVQSFKQVAADQSHLEQRCFHLKAYLQEVAWSLAPQLKQTPHTLTVDGEDTLVVGSYPGALAQIATNLVTNSLTHAYLPSEAGQLRFDIRQEGDKVKIEYEDNGCGIAQENIDKIFEPFFTTARHRGGTGLGLHIVYNLVIQKLQGTIDVHSKINEGTRFVITLPQFFDR